jgi:hypothetical protein
MQDKFLDIQAYNLAEFCQKVEAAFNAGYEFDFKDNARYPTSFGSFFSSGMRLKQTTVAAEAPETAVVAQAVVINTDVAATESNEPTDDLTTASAQKRSKVK